MSSNPEQISRLSLLFRALILTVVMALISGRLETKKFDSVSQWRSAPAQDTTNLIPREWTPNSQYLTRYFLPSEQE